MNKVIVMAALLGTFSVGQSFAQQATEPTQSAQTGQPGPGRRGQFRNMTPVEAKDLPAAIASTVKDKYPDATIRRSAKNDQGKYVVVVTDKQDARTMLLFDEKGALTTERQLPKRQPGDKNGHWHKNKAEKGK
ncbi:hypothetical protein [Spirosoma fluminis]